MVDQKISAKEQSRDFDPHVAMFSIRYADPAPAHLCAQSAGRPSFGVLPTADGGKVVWALR